MELRVLVGGIRRAAWLIALLAVAGLLVGLQLGGGSSNRAQASLLLDPSAIAAVSGTDAADRFIEDQINILRSRPVAEAAAAEVGDVSAEEVAGALSAQQRVGSNIVDIVASASSEERATAIVDAVASVYLQRPRAQEDARGERIEELEAELEEIQAELVTVQAQLLQADDDPPASLSVAQDTLLRRFDQLLPRLVSLQFTEIPADRTAQIEPATPLKTDRSGALSAALGLIVGAGLGVAVSSAVLVASPRVVDDRYAEYLLGVPTVATIPLRRRRGGTSELPAAASQPMRQLTAVINGTPVAVPPRKVAVCQPSASDAVTAPIARALAHASARHGLDTVYLSLAPDESSGTPSPELDSGWTVVDLAPRLRQWIPGRGASVSATEVDRLLDAAPGVDVIVFDLGTVFHHEASLAIGRTADDVVLTTPLWSQASNELRLIREALIEPNPARTHLVLTSRRWLGSTTSSANEDRATLDHS